MISVVVLFFSVIISAFLVDKFNLNERILRLLLAFSGAYLLTVAFTHIIPNIFSGSDSEFLGYFVLLGFFVQLLIEYISGGAEHGHGHCGSHNGYNHDESINISPYALLIGISLHAFFEGIPFASQFHQHAHTQHSLLLGIVIHKIPIAVVLMGLFLNSTKSRIKVYSLMLIFALASPLGAIFGGYIGVGLGIDIDYFYKIIMAILVGIFLHVSTTILFESNTSHRFNFFKLLIIFIGITFAILSKLI
jgi:zinc transporter ZupT